LPKNIASTGLLPARPAPLGMLGLCIFSALLLAPAFIAPFLADAPLGNLVSALGLSIVLWSFWLALWGKPYRACLLATPFLLITPIALYLLLIYHTYLNQTVVGIIL
jgi:hypothetical protein